MTTPKSEWEQFIETVRVNHRPHAGYFSWESDRTIEEAGVVQSLDESLEHQSDRFFSSYRSRGENNDPPDCDAVGLNGERIGIEVTELVDGESIGRARKYEPTEWEPWDEDDLVATIQERIARKDTPSDVRGGPYDQYVLIIYTDEPRVLDYDLIERLRGESFGPTRLITHVYFLMSYSPWTGYCPYVQFKKTDA